MAENKSTNQNENENQAELRANSDSPKNLSSNLLIALTDASANLFYTSETDEPFEAFVWQPETDANRFLAVKAADVLKLAEVPPETVFSEQTLEDFFRFPTTEQDWQSEEEKETVKRYVNLKDLIESKLRDAKVYKIGQVEIDIYVVGIDEDKNLAGVKTKAVET